MSLTLMKLQISSGALCDCFIGRYREKRARFHTKFPDRRHIWALCGSVMGLKVYVGQMCPKVHELGQTWTLPCVLLANRGPEASFDMGEDRCCKGQGSKAPEKQKIWAIDGGYAPNCRQTSRKAKCSLQFGFCCDKTAEDNKPLILRIFRNGNKFCNV